MGRHACLTRDALSVIGYQLSAISYQRRPRVFELIAESCEGSLPMTDDVRPVIIWDGQ
jgi:hypothetical protein